MITPRSPSLAQPATGTVPTIVGRVGWTAVAAAALPFLLYWLTLAPTVYNLDSAELTTAVASNGVMRATGYPLYLLLGKLFAWLPVGDVGYRLNLFSAVCGAATLFIGDRLLRRLDVGPWARFGALGLLATAPYFWALSLIAEVYTLHTALMAGVIWLLLRWRERPTTARLATAVFLLALSLGNHAATALLVPGAVYFVLAHQPDVWRRPRVWAAVGGAALLGVAVYLLLPLRYAAGPAFNYAGQYDAWGVFTPVDLSTWDGFWWLVSGRAFAGQMFGYGWTAVAPEVGFFLGELWVAFLGVGLGPGVLGMVVLLRRDRRLGLFLLLLFLANAVFYINYRVVDKATMFLPNYVVWALWLGIGYQVLLDRVRGWAQGARATRLLRVALVGAVLVAMGWHWARVDLSDDWSTREQSETILATVGPDAIIFGWWDTVPGIHYMQLVEGTRPDVLAINRFLIDGDDMHALIVRELGERPLYVNNPSVDLLRLARVVPEGTLYRLEPKGGGE